MVLMKTVANANPGDADHVGGNDWDKVANYYNDIDVGEIPRINTPTEFRSGILKVRDGSNAFNVVHKSATQTANRDFTIPALIGNDSPATLGLQNNFIAVQQVTLDADTLLNLYRPVSTTNVLTGLGFYARNSSNAPVVYSAIYNKLITNTAGDEDGKLTFWVKKDGTLTEVMSVDKNGLLTVSSISVAPTLPANLPTILKNTGVITTTASSVAEFDMLNYTIPANTIGANGLLRIRVSGNLVQNDATSRAFRIKIKLGGTTLFDDITQSMTQQSVNRPFILQFTIGNNNATNAQSGSGSLRVTLGDVAATVGDGDINDDETQVNSHFGFAGTKDTTTSLVLQVTMTMATSSASVSTSVRRQVVELLPGV